MDVDFSTAVDFLLKNGYLAQVNGEITLTGKFKRTFNPLESAKAAEVFKESPPIFTQKDIWEKFVKDAEIPHRVSNQKGQSYTVRQYSNALANRLAKIIADPDIDYKTLVQSTKNYYRSNAFKFTLHNYFEKEVWKIEYDNYEQEHRNNSVDTFTKTLGGGNPFED
jgi:hypothetical protein